MAPTAGRQGTEGGFGSVFERHLRFVVIEDEQHLPDRPEPQRRLGAGVTAVSGTAVRRIRGLRPMLGVAGPGLVAAAALALVGLASNDAWMDEACSIAATVQFRTVLDRTSGTMASYYLILNGWIRVSDSLWWIRLLSLITALVAIVLTGVAATRFRQRTTATWACLLLGVSWMLVRYAREARSFTLVLVVVLVAWLAADRTVGGGGRRWMLVHVAALVLAPLTHGLSVIAMLVQVPALLVARVPWRTALRLLPGQVLMVGVVGYLYQRGASEVGAGPRFSVDGAVDVVLQLNGGVRWERFTLFDPRYLILLASLYGTVLAARSWWRAPSSLDRWRAVAPVVWAWGAIGGLFVLSAARPQLIDRYAIAAIPALAILQADAALDLNARLARWKGRGRHRRILPVVPAALALTFLVAQVPLHQKPLHTWSEVAETLATRAQPGDALVVPRPSGRLPLDYAWSQLDGPLPELVSVNPTHRLGLVQRYGSRVRWDDMVARALEVDRVWVMRAPRSMGDPEFEQFVTNRDIWWTFERAEEHVFRGARLVLLVRRDPPLSLEGRSGPGTWSFGEGSSGS